MVEPVMVKKLADAIGMDFESLAKFGAMGILAVIVGSFLYFGDRALDKMMTRQDAQVDKLEKALNQLTDTLRSNEEVKLNAILDTRRDVQDNGKALGRIEGKLNNGP